jgi:hypothetical protein
VRHARGRRPLTLSRAGVTAIGAHAAALHGDVVSRRISARHRAAAAIVAGRGQDVARVIGVASDVPQRSRGVGLAQRDNAGRSLSPAIVDSMEGTR